MREKAVREAERDPRAAGVMVEGVWWSAGVERWVRSLRIAVLCFRAELKEVFCGWLLVFWVRREVRVGKWRRVLFATYHSDCFSDGPICVVLQFVFVC